MDVTPFDAVRTSAKPVVSAVNGLCQGGGMQIALCSDLSVVSERATFRVPELFRGYADTYYSQMLVRLIGPVRTRDLMFTGRVLTAVEALDWGLVTRVVPHESLLDRGERPAGAVPPGPRPRARGVIKSSIDSYLGLYDRIGMTASLATRRPAKASARSRSAARRTGCIRTCASRDGYRSIHSPWAATRSRSLIPA